MARVVVGVDASPGARRALAWAAAEARLRRAVLEVVHAYQARHLAAPFYFPSQHAVPGTTEDAAMEPAQLEMAATMQDRAEFEEVYRRRAERFLEGLLGELDGGLQVYLHRLAARDEVVEWVKGTLLTDYQARMPPELFEEFLATYRRRLLPLLEDTRPYRYPFKRLLLWGRRGSG